MFQGSWDLQDVQDFSTLRSQNVTVVTKTSHGFVAVLPNVVMYANYRRMYIFSTEPLKLFNGIEKQRIGAFSKKLSQSCQSSSVLRFSNDDFKNVLKV